MEDQHPLTAAYLGSMDAAYQQEFEAEVVATPPDGVILNTTYFYPVGGGQEADRGTLRPAGGEPIPVVDVRRVSGAIVHRLEKGGLARFRPGLPVHGEIDWDRRYIHMRLHTGQHLLSALAYRRYGRKTVEASMTGHGGYLDLDGPLPEGDALPRLESEANERYFTQPVRVDLLTVSKTEFEAQPGRSSAKGLPPRITSVRLVLIEGIDRCACGGTHVRSTKEVGRVRVQAGPSSPSHPYRVSFELLEGGTASPF